VLQPSRLSQQSQPQLQLSLESLANLLSDRSLFPYQLWGGLSAKNLEAFLNSNLNSSQRLTHYNYINGYMPADD